MYATQWIFLRGLVRESSHWDGFPERFAAAIPGAKVCLADLPGTGRYWGLPSPLTMQETMEAVRREVLASLNAQGSAITPFYLLTISLGSMLAIEWAKQYPEELAGAVLINTSLRGLNPLYQRLSYRVWPLLARIIATPDASQRERLILTMTSANKHPNESLIKTRVDIHQRHPVQLQNVFRQLWAAARYHPPQSKPSIPLILLNSLGDRMVSPVCTETIARLWNVETKTHSSAGHDLPLDDAEWVISQVFEWLMTETRLSRDFINRKCQGI